MSKIARHGIFQKGSSSINQGAVRLGCGSSNILAEFLYLRVDIKDILSVEHIAPIFFLVDSLNKLVQIEVPAFRVKTFIDS